jgi:hypothetical protein
MREYGVTVCSEECGKTRFDDGWMVQCYKSAISFGVEFRCPHCGTRVGVDEDGPWREAMVPKEKFLAACYRMQDWGTWLAYQAAENGDEALCRSLFAQCGFGDLGEEWNWDCGRITEWLYNEFKYGWRQTGLLEAVEGERLLPVDADRALGEGPFAAMVPRAALEWLAGKRGWMGCPGEWDCEAWCDERCASSDEEVAACWVRSALKAAEEANASE